MLQKSVLISLGIVVALIAICALLYVKTDLLIPHYRENNYSHPYYQGLAKQCELKQSVGCCLASVNAMQAGSYQLPINGKCPDGYDREMMKCIDSYQWCQPSILKQTNQNLFQQCISNEGKWLSEYKECEWSVGLVEVLQNICQKMNGVFNSCASPCRHNSSNGSCIASCDFVCSF